MGVGGGIILNVTHMWKNKNGLRILVLIAGNKCKRYGYWFER